MKLSIVTTLYYSSQYLNDFYEQIKAKAEKITDSFEIVFVDDGSPDNSLQIAIGLSKKDKRVKVVELSRNFGHHKAMATGLENASGEYVFLIDSDLEEDPSLLEKFWSIMHQGENKDKVDVVYGVQEKRKGGWFERYSGAWFYILFNMLSDKAKIERNFLVVRLMKAQYVKEFIKFKDQEYYFAPVSSLTGFSHLPVTVKKGSHSPTTYNFFRKYNMLINSIFSFSDKPLYFIFYFGMVVTLFSFGASFLIILKKLLYNDAISGWSSIVLSIFFFSGIIILFIGIIAIYISKIFNEAKQRPFTIIKAIHQNT